MSSLQSIIEYLEKRFPLVDAAEWDRPGLAIGSASSEISRAMLAVDFTAEVLQEAIETSAQLVITHHPPLLKPPPSLDERDPKASLITRAIRANISVYSAHTNADFAKDGVSRTLGELLGLSNLSALTESGEGVVGTVSEMPLIDFARYVAKALPSCAEGILVQGEPGALIGNIGLVAGAGDSYLSSALRANLDLFITSDLRHHPSSDFREASRGMALMKIPHFAAEWPWLDVLANGLRSSFPAVEFVVSEINTDPWDFAVMQ